MQTRRVFRKLVRVKGGWKILWLILNHGEDETPTLSLSSAEDEIENPVPSQTVEEDHSLKEEKHET